MLTGAFKTYARMLRGLHEEIGAGRGEAETADQIREVMDRAWQEMTGIERKLGRVLSADIYDLHDPKARQSKPSDKTGAERVQSVQRAYQSEEWATALLTM